MKKEPTRNKSRGSTRNEDEWKGIRMGKDRKMYGIEGVMGFVR